MALSANNANGRMSAAMVAEMDERARLISAARGGDIEAEKKLYERYHMRVISSREEFARLATGRQKSARPVPVPDAPTGASAEPASVGPPPTDAAAPTLQRVPDSPPALRRRSATAPRRTRSLRTRCRCAWRSASPAEQILLRARQQIWAEIHRLEKLATTLDRILEAR
jgi:hypothetical protein